MLSVQLPRELKSREPRTCTQTRPLAESEYLLDLRVDVSTMTDRCPRPASLSPSLSFRAIHQKGFGGWSASACFVWFSRDSVEESYYTRGQCPQA